MVEFGDGSKDSVAYPITLQENNLQANFMPSDTTTCNQCVDLNEMLDVSSGEEGQGGGTGGGGTGGGQGGGQTNYEYFWSNKKDEGWIPEGANEVCEPGLYWALVREPGSSCYVYAQTRVKMWDPETDQKIDDQTNSVWYFGQNGGLNFNPTLTTRMELSPAQWKTLVLDGIYLQGLPPSLTKPDRFCFILMAKPFGILMEMSWKGDRI
ncbi:hypothetical protein QWY93_18665 [Echinicola jeungdonensis]|uniref:hypothetical protein n=1 Tax=Echinicola jeungdonensis TaxID=709343 RepID=UPI0025B3D17F|nr:hypothetical protein [Echinicola jeungdonensis]MDN3671298.1 hypothetical protein [Echinicola jeungdonensis]